MESKKIYLVVTPFFPAPWNWRGAYVLDQVKAIKRHSNYEIVVIREIRHKTESDYYEIDGIKVHLFKSVQMPSYILNGLPNGINSFLFLRFLKKTGIDVSSVAVVHAHTASYACFATAVKRVNPKVKSLVQYHDRDPYQILYGRFSGVKMNALFRVWKFIHEFKYLDAHICISEIVRDNLLNFPDAAEYEHYQPYLDRLKQVKCFSRPKDVKAIVLYNGVDCSLFKPADKNSINHNTHTLNHFRIGCIANFLPLKGQMTLIKAVEIIVKNKSIPKLKVMFVGSGMLMDDCKSYISEHNLGEYFMFLKEVEHGELSNFYRSLDLFVLPTMYEGFGCVFTEAAACGVPFMICEHQGASEYISSEEADRWLIHPNDYEQLADMIVRQYVERATQKLTKPYDIDTLIKEYLLHIDKL